MGRNNEGNDTHIQFRIGSNNNNYKGAQPRLKQRVKNQLLLLLLIKFIARARSQ